MSSDHCNVLQTVYFACKNSHIHSSFLDCNQRSWITLCNSHGANFDKKGMSFFFVLKLELIFVTTTEFLFEP